MADHNELGKQGEILARNFLLKKGYEILEFNYRFKHLEIDLICGFGEEIVVVEVKTRNNDVFQKPELAVTRTKQKQIIKATNHYLIENQIDKEVRFDVIGIVLNTNTKSVNHIEGAFYPTL